MKGRNKQHCGTCTWFRSPDGNSATMCCLIKLSFEMKRSWIRERLRTPCSRITQCQKLRAVSFFFRVRVSVNCGLFAPLLALCSSLRIVFLQKVGKHNENIILIFSKRYSRCVYQRYGREYHFAKKQGVSHWLCPVYFKWAEDRWNHLVREGEER